MKQQENELHLAPWCECVARFLGLEINESEVCLVLSCGAEDITLSFSTGSLESQTLQRELASCITGTKIALIKTDETLRPLLVRIIEA